MAIYWVRRNTKYKGKFYSSGSKIEINELDDVGKMNVQMKLFVPVEKPRKKK